MSGVFSRTASSPGVASHATTASNLKHHGSLTEEQKQIVQDEKRIRAEMEMAERERLDTEERVRSFAMLTSSLANRHIGS